MTKNIFINTLLFVLLLSVLAAAQIENKDSVEIINSPQPVENIISKFDELEFYRELNSMKINIPINNDTNTVWLWTSYALSKSGFENQDYGKTLSNVSRFLYNEYMEESKFNPVKYALGLAQAGAVGYLAYMHIKKYGFLR